LVSGSLAGPGALAERGQALPLQRLEIGAGPLLGYGAGEDRDVATAVIVLILDAPDTRSIPVFHEPNISVNVLLDCAVAVALVAFALLALRGVLGREDFLECSRTICHAKTASIRH
jgi:hypothetical protein